MDTGLMFFLGLLMLLVGGVLLLSTMILGRGYFWNNPGGYLIWSCVSIIGAGMLVKAILNFIKERKSEQKLHKSSRKP